jgi:hypothetical protein
MGCGQSAAEDKEIELHHQEMQELFRQRSESFHQEEIEEIISELFRHLASQQLTRGTWDAIDQLREHITRNTPENNKLYYRAGYWFHSV